MITTMYTLGVIFIMIAIFLLVEMVIQLTRTNDLRWMFLLLMLVFLLGFGIPMVCEEPTDSDVIYGRAHYVKVTHEYNSCSKVTYEIEWNDKSKHSLKK